MTYLKEAYTHKASLLKKRWYTNHEVPKMHGITTRNTNINNHDEKKNTKPQPCVESAQVTATQPQELTSRIPWHCTWGTLD